MPVAELAHMALGLLPHTACHSVLLTWDLTPLSLAQTYQHLEEHIT
jgi:hypothetical protein